MARGGMRPGAGRKAGAAHQRTREIADKAALEGNTPLEYMLAVLSDPTADQKRRDAMAVASAPYMHARLQAVSLGSEPEKPVAMRISWVGDREK